MAEEQMIPLVTVITLLVAVGIGAFVYFNVTSAGEMGDVSQLFTLTNTTYGVTTNAYATLPYLPADASHFVVKYYGNSTGTWNTSVVDAAVPLTIGKYMRNGTTFVFNGTMPAHHHQNITAVNITYYTEAGAMLTDTIAPTVGTIFSIAPIAAVVLIAAVILGLVMGFGKKEV